MAGAFLGIAAVTMIRKQTIKCLSSKSIRPCLPPEVLLCPISRECTSGLKLPPQSRMQTDSVRRTSSQLNDNIQRRSERCGARTAYKNGGGECTPIHILYIVSLYNHKRGGKTRIGVMLGYLNFSAGCCSIPAWYILQCVC